MNSQRLPESFVHYVRAMLRQNLRSFWFKRADKSYCTEADEKLSISKMLVSYKAYVYKNSEVK